MCAPAREIQLDNVLDFDAAVVSCFTFYYVCHLIRVLKSNVCEIDTASVQLVTQSTYHEHEQHFM